MSQHWHYYYLKSTLEMMSLVLNWCPIPALGSHLRCQSNGILSHHVSLRSSWPWPLLTFSLFLRTLTVMRSHAQVFHRMSLNWDLSHVFLVIRLRLWIWGVGRTREAKSIFIPWYEEYVPSTSVLIVSGSPVSWLRSCLLGFSTVNLLYSLLLFILYSPVYKKKNCYVHLMLPGGMSVFRHLFISVWMCGLFIL